MLRVLPTTELADGWVKNLRLACLLAARKHFLPAVLAAILCLCDQALAADLAIKEVQLPALRIHGQPARAHTQGMEVVGGQVYVTERRDDVRPRRALLLRTEPTGTNWDVWDITPLDAQGSLTGFDHPGGMQSDGTRLWIPLAESRRNGRSMICAFRQKDIEAGRLLKPELEFSFDDHIGAVAVSTERELLLGANWDTQKVYVWNFKGHLQRTLTNSELRPRELGMASAEGRNGLAVQDWKFSGDRLFASGLFRPGGTPAGSTESRVICFTNFLEIGFQRLVMTLPLVNGTQLAREAMTISEGIVHFLPEDLGETNRMFQILLEDLARQGVAGSSNLGTR